MQHSSTSFRFLQDTPAAFLFVRAGGRWVEREGGGREDGGHCRETSSMELYVTFAEAPIHPGDYIGSTRASCFSSAVSLPVLSAPHFIGD